jgi:hypothetical protein
MDPFQPANSQRPTFQFTLNQHTGPLLLPSRESLWEKESSVDHG